MDSLQGIEKKVQTHLIEGLRQGLALICEKLMGVKGVILAVEFRSRDVMKRLMMVILLAVLYGSDVNAQSFLQRQSSAEQVDARRENMREFKNFEHTLDQFSFSMVVSDTPAARRIKSAIELDMLREVEQSRRLVRKVTGDPRFDRMNSPQYLDKGMYSKRNNEYDISQYTKNIGQLVNRYRVQQILYYEFKETEISRGRGVVNENKHRKIMYDFLETMKEDLEWSISER